MSCGCSSSNGSSPPGGFSPAPSAPAGSTSSFGGNSAISVGPCAPVCPQPPTASQVGRTGYCQSWVTNLFGSYSGKMIIKVDGCLNFLLSKVSGWVRYDATTETVVVDNAPPFTSSQPRAAKFGYAAKTVPVQTFSYDPVSGGCVTNVTQQLASQVLEQRADGQILLGNMPLCGDLPVNESADANNQMRYDYLDPETAEEQPTVSDDVGFLVNIPWTQNVGPQSFVKSLWLRMRNISMRLSQWGQILTSDVAFDTARTLVAVPIPGGTSTDPAYRLMMTDAPPAGVGRDLPLGNSGSVPMFLADPLHGYYPSSDKNVYISAQRGLGWFPLNAASQVVTNRTTVGTISISLPSPITRPNEGGITPQGPVSIRLRTRVYANASTESTLTLGTDIIGEGRNDNVNTAEFDVFIGAWTGTISLVVAKPSGSGTIRVDVWVVGYSF